MPIVGLAASAKVSLVGLVRVMSGIRVGLVDVVDGLGMLGSSVGFVDDDAGRLVEDGCAAVPFSKCCSITSLETKEFVISSGLWHRFGRHKGKHPRKKHSFSNAMPKFGACKLILTLFKK